MEALRGQRLPIFDPGDRFWFPKNPNVFRVWVTDVKNQVQDHLDSGFQFVTRKELDQEARGARVGDVDPRERQAEESRVCLFVGRAHVQENAKAYLMQTPIERWRAIQALKAEENTRPIRELRRDTKGLQQGSGMYGEGLKDDAKA